MITTVYSEGKTIYLCGPIADRTDDQCRGWREYVKEHFNGHCLDPMRRDYRNVEIDRELAEKIVEDDLEDISNSDGLLVYFDNPSVGTSMEVFHAYRAGKRVVIVNASGRKTISPWLMAHCDAVIEVEPGSPRTTALDIAMTLLEI